MGALSDHPVFQLVSTWWLGEEALWSDTVARHRGFKQRSGFLYVKEHVLYTFKAHSSRKKS